MIDPQTKEKYAVRVGDLSSDCSVLTASLLSDINQTFYADGIDSSLSAANLSVRYVTGDQYHELIAGSLSDSFEPKTLYVVSSDLIDAYNTRVKNVADPEEEKDAANKWYVDQACESVLNIVEDGNEDYYKKSETSSSSELSNVFEDALSSDAVKIGLNALTAQKSSGIDVRSIAIGKNADASNITYNNAQSIAIGADSSAVGEASIAVGSQAEANGTSGSSPTGGLNVSIGYRAKADGKMAIAIGAAPGGVSSISADYYPYAGNTGSIAIGTNAKAKAQYETVVGYGANGNLLSTGTAGTAFGASANASGAGAVAVGYGASALAQQSIAIGRNTKANATRSIAIGGGQKMEPNDETTALSNYSIAIGFGAKAEGVQSIAIGGTNTGVGNPICKVTAADAVQIGAGTNSTASSLQFKDYQLIDAQGKIPNERLSIDAELLSTSVNPVQNKVILSIINEKADTRAINIALDKKRELTDMGVRGIPQSNGSWFVVKNLSDMMYETLDYSNTDDWWTAGGYYIIRKTSTIGNYILNYNGIDIGTFTLNSNSEVSITDSGVTHFIIGYVDEIAKKSQIPVVDPTLTLNDSAADAKAVGDALRSGFTEWDFSGDTQSGIEYSIAIYVPEEGYYVYQLYGDDVLLEQKTYTTNDKLEVVFSYDDLTITATRHLITPTKTSQLTNDGAPNGGGTPYATTAQVAAKQDALSAAQLENIAAVPGKANKTELPYVLVEPGVWEFSDGEAHGISGPNEYNGTWYYTSDVYVSNVFNSESEAVTALTLTFTDPSEQSDTFTATRPSLPGNLLDRAVNAVSINATTAFTIPASTYSSKARDLYVNLDVQNSAQTVTINSNDENNNPITLLNNSNNFTLSQGHHVIRVLEVAQSTFIVSELQMLQ